MNSNNSANMSIRDTIDLIKNFKPTEPEFSRWVSSREAFEVVQKVAGAPYNFRVTHTHIVAFGLPIFIYEDSFKATEFAWKFATQFEEKVLLTKVEGGHIVAFVVNGPEIKKEMDKILNPDPFNFSW